MLFPHFLCQVKEVLSANAEYPVKAEQLHDETDLNTKITRCLRTDNSACTCVYMWLLCCLLSPDTATHPLLFLVKLLYSEDRTTNFPPLILSLYRSLTLIRIIRNTSHSLFFISSSYYLITIPFFPPLSLSLSLSLLSSPSSCFLCSLIFLLQRRTLSFSQSRIRGCLWGSVRPSDRTHWCRAKNGGEEHHWRAERRAVGWV